MCIIRNRKLVEDTWRPEWRLDRDGERGALPPGDVIVSYARWRAERDLFRTRAGRVGVALGPGDGIEALSADLSRIDLVTLEFASFADGRGYSQARLLRDRYGFTGEIRATGAISSDLVSFMERCGIDAFELPAEAVPDALEAFAEISVHFQPAADGASHIVPSLRGLRPIEAGERFV